MDCAGLVLVVAIWVAVIWLLVRMLGFNRLDDDPDERDPYN
jgi:hypothetical protein